MPRILDVDGMPSPVRLDADQSDGDPTRLRISYTPNVPKHNGMGPRKVVDIEVPSHAPTEEADVFDVQVFTERMVSIDEENDDGSDSSSPPLLRIATSDAQDEPANVNV